MVRDAKKHPYRIAVNDSVIKQHCITYRMVFTFGEAADLMYQSRILASYMSGSSSYINHFIAGYWRQKIESDIFKM